MTEPALDHELDRSRLLDQGRLALRAIQSRRDAAQFDADAAELESALLLAKSGEIETLATWLARQAISIREVTDDAPFVSPPAMTQSTPLKELPEWARKSPWPCMLASRQPADPSALQAFRVGSNESIAGSFAKAGMGRQGLRQGPKSFPSRKRWTAWGVSAAVHGCFVAGLGIWTIQAILPPVTMSITASPATTETLAFEVASPAATLPSQTDPLTEVSPEPLATSLEIPIEVPGLASPLHVPTVGSSAAESSTSMDAVAKAAASGNGPMPQATFFGAQAQGNTFVYLVDNSGSMRRDRAFEAAKVELIRSLQSLRESQRYYVMFFGERLEKLSLDGLQPESRPIRATPGHIATTIQWVQRIPIRGGKAPNDALEAAIALEPDAIFLLFDGDTQVDVASHLRRINRYDDLLQGTVPRVSIHTIGIYSDEHSDLLRRIASENLGSYRFVPKPMKSR